MHSLGGSFIQNGRHRCTCLNIAQLPSHEYSLLLILPLCMSWLPLSSEAEREQPMALRPPPYSNQSLITTEVYRVLNANFGGEIQYIRSLSEQMLLVELRIFSSLVYS